MKKLLALCSGIAIMGSSIAYAATEPAPQKTLSYEVAIAFCKNAYFHFSRGDNGKYLDAGMSKLDKVNRTIAALTCAAYGEGVEDGRKMSNT